jgi:LysM repeat protein
MRRRKLKREAISRRTLMSGMMMPAYNPGSILRHGGVSTSNPGSTPSSTTGGATSSGGGTHVFGNLQGRDPDLLFAGEKIMINGKEVTVADGQTLSSLAAQHGTTVEKLISENKMDASLLGQNGPNGAYFTPGGPTPGPGGSVASPPGTSAPQSVPNTSAEAQAALNAIGSQAPKGMSADDFAVLKDLLTQLKSGPLSDTQKTTLEKLYGQYTALSSATAHAA